MTDDDLTGTDIPMAYLILYMLGGVIAAAAYGLYLFTQALLADPVGVLTVAGMMTGVFFGPPILGILALKSYTLYEEWGEDDP